MAEEELKDIMHAGVLGMKWGVRKAQTRVRGKLVDAKTTVRGKVVDKVTLVRPKMSVGDAIKKVKEHAAKVAKAEADKKKSNASKDAALIEAGKLHEIDMKAGKALKDQGSANLRSPNSRAQYELGKAQFKAGEAAMAKAEMDFNMAYKNLPKHQVTIGEKIGTVLVVGVVTAQVLSNRP